MHKDWQKAKDEKSHLSGAVQAMYDAIKAAPSQTPVGRMAAAADVLKQADPTTIADGLKHLGKYGDAVQDAILNGLA